MKKLNFNKTPLNKSIQNKRDAITKIAKQFAVGFYPDIEINKSGPLVVDPLSGYLNSCGYYNTLSSIGGEGVKPLVLIMLFPKYGIFIPAGGDLSSSDFKVEIKSENYMWL